MYYTYCKVQQLWIKIQESRAPTPTPSHEMNGHIAPAHEFPTSSLSSLLHASPSNEQTSHVAPTAMHKLPTSSSPSCASSPHADSNMTIELSQPISTNSTHPATEPSHIMATRSKDGIFKPNPKNALLTDTIPTEPKLSNLL